MLLRQLFDQDSSTYSYLLADEATREAVLIDPVFEQFERDATLIEELGLSLCFALETHVHADHVTSQGLLKQRFGACTVISERAGAVCADRLVKHGDRLRFGRYELEVRETPGHTGGCVSYVCQTPRLAFTGDALLIRGCGRTDFQQGDASSLYRSVHEQVFSLPDDTAIYPAHDYKGHTVSSVGEEKRLNRRLGAQKTLPAFVELMRGLTLAFPKQMQLAVPANLACGLGTPAPRPTAETDSSWAPIALSAAGVPELDADWLAGHRAEVTVIDVREPDEYRGELGHVAGAVLSPLSALLNGSATLPLDRPLVTVCRSGGRSGKAALALRDRGVSRVASLRGGMVEWTRGERAVEYGPPPSAAGNRQG
jgi:sulfur dioxygenase